MYPKKSLSLAFLICIPLIGMMGCGGGVPAESVALGPPEGWEAADGRWWRSGLDTTGVFRRLDTLEEMGIHAEEQAFEVGKALAEQPDPVRRQMIWAVKQSLIRLYRNQPEVIDSLFNRYVVPRLLKASLQGDVRTSIERLKRQSYSVLRRHFLEPRATRVVGKDIAVPYPDSLRARGIGGVVRVQVYIDAEGAPAALALLEGVHPVLDQLALRAITEMRWQPAYLLRGGKSDPIPSWARFKVRFQVPEP